VTLPPDRALALARLPGGSIIKTLLVYPEPFWRDDGLRGETAAPGRVVGQ
jgi:monoamine oxidase